MRATSKYPTLDPARKQVPQESRVDDQGRPICIYCDRRLRFHFGWGYNGSGIFCTMKCAAEWGDIKASAGSD